MLNTLKAIGRRLFTVRYRPAPACQTFAERAQTQQNERAQVTVCVLSAEESRHVFGVPLGSRGIQPVHIRIENRSPFPLRLYVVGVDPNYYTPLEAAAFNHYSLVKRIGALGVLGWLSMPLLALFIPFKMLSAYFANRRMDGVFRTLALPLRPVAPGTVAAGFVYTQMDAGTKAVRVCLHAIHPPAAPSIARQLIEGTGPASAALETGLPTVEFNFYVPVPGIAADHLRRDFEAICPRNTWTDCDLPTLVARLREMPQATTNRRGTGHGDPINLVVLGDFETILNAFAPRWDESEVITLSTCWKTAKSFLLGSEYRYSPVSPLYLFGRSQDVALQRIRHSINERLHLRLWLTPLRFQETPVWVGQISRDIGVRFTPKTWNLTTHRIDPDIDESRDYLVEDLLQAEHVDAVAYVDGVPVCGANNPLHNLTGDPYYTDGKRAVVRLAKARTNPRFVMWA